MIDLARRRLTRVALAYIVVASAVTALAFVVFPLFELPAWTPTLVALLAILGFPVAIVLVWAYDIPPAEPGRADSSTSREGWQQAQRLLETALMLPATERTPFILRATGTDQALRDEVDTLLRAHDRQGPLDRPASEWFGPLLSGSVRSGPAEGRIVGHYQIFDKLGGGGMGVVYRARDRRLGRTVALKFLPPHLSHDADAKQRFMLEAQAAAALDHPHICTLLEIGQTEDGQMFLAMPLYDGDTLAHRITRGALTVAEVIDLAAQAADGLAAAHARGIVHRDIKPANLVITREGVLKVVDFGIAKLADASAPTHVQNAGTFVYMSPEQARGEVVDARTDVWSLGVVIYETLTGRRPFDGANSETIMQAILRADPEPLALLRPDAPTALVAIVGRALARDPADRFESATSLHDALSPLLHEHSADRPADGGGAVPTPENGVAAEGERRQVTLVVSLVCGYAQLIESFDPHELRSAIARIRSATEDVAARFGGVIHRIDDDRVELLFGAPITHEDHCFRAVRAAIELHERVRGIHLHDGAGRCALALQTGVDTGQAIVQPGRDSARLRLIGGPGRAAARLQTHAAPDQLWITPACQRIVGAFFDSVPCDAVTLDNVDPVTPYRILRLSGMRTRIEAAQRVGLTKYVGRELELAELTHKLESARSGHGALVAVQGEAGSGKSRLLHEFRHAVNDVGVEFLMGRCESHGSTVAYLPFIEVLRRRLGIDDVEAGERAGALVACIRGIGEELEALIPLYLHLFSLSHPDYSLPAHLQGETLRHAMNEAVAGAITLLTRRGPVVLLLEDWHWADDASGAVLRQIADVASGHSLCVVVTTRPGTPGLGPMFNVLPLGPLGVEASSEMLRTVIGASAIPDLLAERIHARTGGNPFFIEEVGRTLMEEGALRLETGVARFVGSADALQLPDTVEAVIRARLDRLDRDTRDVARLASVIGREFERRLLEVVLEGGSRLPHAIQTLKAAGLIQQIRVVPDAAYRFNHVLTQEVAYASLLERQRIDLHGRVGQAIESLHVPHLEDHYVGLAHHFSRAGSWERAIHYGTRAAERITALSAFDAALHQLELCEGWIDRIDDDAVAGAVRIDVLLRQERLCETLGLRARQQQLIDRIVAYLETSEDRCNLAEAYLRQGDLFTLLRRFADAERVLMESLRLRRELDGPEAIRNTLRSLGLLRWHEHRHDEAIVFIEEALAIDRRYDDVDALIGDLANMGAVLKSKGELSRARTTLEEALTVMEQRRAGVALFKESYILQNLANVHRQLGENDVAMQYLDRAKRMSERERLPIQLSYHFTSIAHLCLQEGRLDDALDFYTQAVELSRKARFTPGLSQSLRMLGEVLLGLGREVEALPYLTEGAALFAQLEDARTEAGLWRHVARAHERLGNADAAVEAWTRAAPLFARVHEADGEVEALDGIARMSKRAGRPDDIVLNAHTAALARAEQTDAGAVQARLLNALGIIAWESADYGAALERYEAALVLFRRLGDAGGSGLMLNSIGVTLTSMGRHDDARARLDEALIEHRQAGNRLLEGHALAALGDIALRTAEPAVALRHFTESLALRGRIGDRRGVGWMHSRVAVTHISLGRPDLAQQHAAEAHEIAAAVGDDSLAAACDMAQLTAIH